MLILFVTLIQVRITFGLIWDTFVVEFGVFRPLLVNLVRMLAFRSLQDVFWIIFGAPNGASGILVDGIRLASILIWTPKVDKIV